jgi:hypothetical protein
LEHSAVHFDLTNNEFVEDGAGGDTYVGFDGAAEDFAAAKTLFTK